MIQGRQVRSFALVGAAVIAGVFSGTVGRPPPPPNPCADRFIPPKYYMRECVVRVKADHRVSNINENYHRRTVEYLFYNHKDVCRPSIVYNHSDMFFIFYVNCYHRFEVTNNIIKYMKSYDESYPYNDIDYDFTFDNDYVQMEDGGSFTNYGEWIAEFPYRPPTNGLYK